MEIFGRLKLQNLKEITVRNRPQELDHRIAENSGIDTHGFTPRCLFRIQDAPVQGLTLPPYTGSLRSRQSQ